MKKKAVVMIVLAAVALWVSPAAEGYAQHEGKARLKGIVTGPDAAPLAGVIVKLYSHKAGAGLEVKTDKKGQWKALWIRGGKWDIDFDKAGFQPKKISSNLKEDTKIVFIETTLEPSKGPALNRGMMDDFDKGNKLFSRGKIAEALAIYETIIKKFPDSYAIYLNIGNCHFDKQNYQKAIDAYQKLVEKEPNHTDALLSIGNSYSNLKQNQKALEYYKKIDVSKINDPLVLYNIGVFNFNAGKTKEAINFLKRSTQVKADFPDGWYQLGMSYMGDGQNDAAVAAFNAYLKLDGQSEKAGQVKEILEALKQ
ncbi:MAG: tetratricopeptide repeat protein [bacterium]|nr:tetratricopeptide repeat protein [bacterium]